MPNLLDTPKPAPVVAQHSGGELSLAVWHFEGQVYLDFEGFWVNMPPHRAMELGALIQRQAHEAKFSRTQ